MGLETHHSNNVQQHFDETFRKHLVDRPGKLVFVGNHLTRRDNVRCLVRYISRQGADLEVSPFLSVMDHFLLSIQGIDEEISATLIRREDERAYISFVHFISPNLLYSIRRLSRGTSN